MHAPSATQGRALRIAACKVMGIVYSYVALPVTCSTQASLLFAGQRYLGMLHVAKVSLHLAVLPIAAQRVHEAAEGAVARGLDMQHNFIALKLT